MRPIQIITDSCSDLSPALLERYGIDYAVMSTVCEGRETPATLTWTAEEAHALYNVMREGRRVTTAQVSVEEFNRIFRKHLDRGRDVIYIGCSSRQSGSVNTGYVTARGLSEEYPDARILCVDSLNASLGEGMLAIEAARLAAEGRTIDEIETHLLATRKRINQFVTVHSLDSLRRAGRVKGSAAFFGNLMGVKPILVSDVNGDQVAMKKVKGRANSLREIVALLKESMTDTVDKTVYIAHADCDKAELEELIANVREAMPDAKIEVSLIGPIIGASIGPDAFGVWGMGRPVTFRLGD